MSGRINFFNNESSEKRHYEIEFDYWGKVPEDAEEKKVIDGLRAACQEVWHDCKEHPENYNFEPIPRLEEHKAIYDVGCDYI